MNHRKLFLTFAALIAFGVGSLALVAPAALLASKGVAPSPAAGVWVREVGALLIAVGLIAWLVRAHADSPTLRAVLAGNALLQFLLLPIEPIAFAQGVITAVPGIVPNTALHLLLGLGFATFALRMGRASPR